jgi:hypothetical protein
MEWLKDGAAGVLDKACGRTGSQRWSSQNRNGCFGAIDSSVDPLLYSIMKRTNAIVGACAATMYTASDEIWSELSGRGGQNGFDRPQRTVEENSGSNTIIVQRSLPAEDR